MILVSDIFCFSLPNLYLLRQVPSIIEYFPTVSEVEENPEDSDSTANLESHAEVAEESEASKEEDNNLFNPEAPSAEHKILDDELTDTTESGQDGNDVDRVPFVNAALEMTSAQLGVESS